MEFTSVNTLWVLLGAALVFFMQAGFAMCEAGFTRAKNAGNIIMKNLMDFSIGTPVFWILGFGLMFGAGSAVIGWIDPLILKDYQHIIDGLGIPLPAYIIFQTVFCATAATIVSGSMAERTKFSSYCLYSLCISAVVYPISGHWIWGGGWLSEMGFHDFAGSTAVHMVGGVAALVGAKILGPRIGKYDKDGKPKAIPGHSLPLGALGVFILWFCWFGFNGCSTIALDTDESMISAGYIFVNTNLSAAMASCSTMIFTWLRYGKPDVSMALNGALAGLVAITAGCDLVNPVGAAIIGLVAGILLVLGVEFFDKVAKIDDPVGAISVHGVCGAFGTICTGLFALDGGVFYGGGFKFFGTQVLGVAAVIAWVVVMMLIIFTIIKKTIGLRVSPEEELMGLDATEHNLPSAYADFAATSMLPTASAYVSPDEGKPESDIDKAVPVTNVEIPDAKPSSEKSKMSKVVIITNQSKFESLKAAMDELGVTGMTVTNVLGCGQQKGKPEYYRGVAVSMNLLPKVKVELVVSKIPVDAIVHAAKKALYTGHIGDGKLFVYDVENVVKIRTGEQGYDALQDEE